MLISVVTPSIRPPEMVNSLCGRWVRGQDVDHEVEHIIHYDQNGSVWKNKSKALWQAKGDVIVFMDDDDWYGPQYLRTIVGCMEGLEAFGFKQDISYHLPSGRYRRYAPKPIGPLPATLAIRSCLKEAMLMLLEWETPEKTILKRSASSLAGPTEHFLAIRGLPPRGQSKQHTAEKHPNRDDGFEFLVHRIGGEAFEAYMEALRAHTRTA